MLRVFHTKPERTRVKKKMERKKGEKERKGVSKKQMKRHGQGKDGVR